MQNLNSIYLNAKSLEMDLPKKINTNAVIVKMIMGTVVYNLHREDSPLLKGCQYYT